MHKRKRGWLNGRRVLALVLAAAVAATWLYSGALTRTPAERAMRRMLNALENGNLSKAERYVSGGDLGLLETSWRAKRFYKAVFSTIQYSVSEVRVEDNTAQIVVTVTMVDMEQLLNAEALDVLARSLAGKKGADRNFYKKLTKVIKSGNVQRVTNTVTAHLVLTDKGWKVDLGRGELVTAITGDLPGLLLNP